MWLATTRGFYSVVAHTELPDTVMVRARVRQDLVNLLELAPDGDRPPIVATPRNDYPFRVIVPAEWWHQVAARLVAEITYPNFKAAVDKVSHRHHDAYTRVWGVLRSGLELPGARRGAALSRRVVRRYSAPIADHACLCCGSADHYTVNCPHDIDGDEHFIGPPPALF